MENNNKVNLIGKIAKFPKNTKAVHALTFLEKIKVNPKKMWYIIIEDQEKDLKLVKYNRNNDISLKEYTLELKEYYKKKYKNDKNILEKIEKIHVDAEKDFSVIRDIPNIVINEKTLISIIASDLIKLLSK